MLSHLAIDPSLRKDQRFCLKGIEPLAKEILAAPATLNERSFLIKFLFKLKKTPFKIRRYGISLMNILIKRFDWIQFAPACARTP